MKFGANTQIWVAPFKAEDIGLIEKVAEMGFDVIELGVASEKPPFETKQVRQRLKDTGLESCVCSFIPADRDIAGSDPGDATPYQGEAIRVTGRHLKHFHACENDRGTPGSGQVRWNSVRDALRDIRYDSSIVIEGFNPEVVDLANGARIWRPMAPTPDDLARDGLEFLTNLFS